ncbi:MAG TPA: sigma-54 dependent transcriptional regulator [Thermodesulfobacteriota bacterium]|nr:sigma-54 dependent transcriptional regulator [Thermodesulfobacteriota bacterium]HNU71475.1 sigma-54 dependent transcriptional regulator [Thermodesulfobacteriota bacterium]HOC38964.1 sigma-54 dependent transcriptional regulator [Thermodesulfobacteriota bacterium]HQO77488.1 sigma-54 dependent transcriptional regulator [Thermodesulfobacteriota bacterium]
MVEKILVVDDESSILKVLATLIERLTPCQVKTCQSGAAALALLKEEDIAVVIADYHMPDLDGMQLLKHVKELIPEQLFIMITGYATVEIAVKAMREGAFDFVTKPIRIDQVSFSIQRALDWHRLQQENNLLRRQVSRTKAAAQLVGASREIRTVCSLIDQVGGTASTVLITGESGTGKELVARAIYATSNRRNDRYITIDWGTIPESLIESELFGHRKGAFTGATSHKRGLLSEADGGTVFLDEIGDIPLTIQAKLLRFIQEGEFKPVGGLQSQRVDARIIAATNKDLTALVKEGRFREDLFYRLNVFHIHIPPLRERNEDVPVLARHFLTLYSSQMRKQVREIDPLALEMLLQHVWPGNVRELENVMEHAVIVCQDTVLGPKDLSFFLPVEQEKENDPSILDLPYQEARDLVLEEFNQFYLGSVLKEYGGNVTRAARKLDMKRQTLQYLIRKNKVSASYPHKTHGDHRIAPNPDAGTLKQVF